MPPPPRSRKALSSSRFEQQQLAHDQVIQAFMEADKCDSLDDLLVKLDQCSLPEEIFLVKRKASVVFIYFEERQDGNVDVKWHMVVSQDCSISMKRDNVPVPLSIVSHLISDSKIRRCSELCNILSALKSFSEDFSSRPEALTSLVHDFKSRMFQVQFGENRTARKLNFLLDQLTMVVTSGKKQRRYSSELLACSALWQTMSPALYRHLLTDDVLCLPSVQHLKRLTSPLDSETGISEKNKIYLQERLKSLTEREKIMVLMADEIYCSQRVEFAGGNFFGLQEEQRIKTVLVFMVKSVAGPFRDVVAMFPMSKLDSEDMKMTTSQVLKTLKEIGMRVILMSVDNATANRKFYTQEFCHGLLTPSIPHPEEPSQPLFLSFDPVHCFKNIFNNFQTRKQFECPTFTNSAVIYPSFQHIEELYNLEKGNPVKMAYKLSDKVLHPTSIEKTNVKLADSVFHDSTIDAMEFFATHGKKDEWRDTLTFLKIIRHWWNIVNVKTITAGKRKIDPRKIPINSSNCESLHVLRNFDTWLGHWENLPNCHKSKKGLTRETFLATKQSNRVLIKVSEYLLETEGFHYVLLGQLQSDIIEGRFGWIRQLSGANYFVSLRQILEAEKSIRVRSLVRYSTCNMEDLRTLFGTLNCIEQKKIEERAAQLADTLQNEIYPEFENEDQNIIFYIAGYLGRSLVRRLKCSNCKMLYARDKSLPLIFEEPITNNDRALQAAFFAQVNRGGLTPPSDLLFAFSLAVFNYFKVVRDDKKAFAFLMSSKNQREVFATSFVKRLEDNSMCLFDTSCDSNHSFLDHGKEICRRLFNFFAKNICADENSDIHASKKRKPNIQSTNRKVAKLQSTRL